MCIFYCAVYSICRSEAADVRLANIVRRRIRARQCLYGNICCWTCTPGTCYDSLPHLQPKRGSIFLCWSSQFGYEFVAIKFARAVSRDGAPDALSEMSFDSRKQSNGAYGAFGN
jgi:hypothetical protein